MAVLRSQMTIPEAKRGGKLVRVPIGRGVSIQMYEDEARARGLWPPGARKKMRGIAQNKKREPGENKGESSERGEDEG